MNVEARQKLSARKLMVALLSLIFVVTLGGLTTVFYVATRSHATPNTTAPLLGSWKLEGGATINFRPDGTGRSRIDRNDSNFDYFEWTLDENNELRILYHGLGRSKLWKSNLYNWVFSQDDPSLSTYKFRQFSDNEIELVMQSVDGEENVLIFNSTSDAELEASP